MSAVDTALRVLEQTLRGNADEPIRGDLRGLSELNDATRFRSPLQDLARASAARLRLDDPPLGDPEPLGVEAAILAAALGGAAEDPDLAESLLTALPKPRGAWDGLVRYALVAPRLATLPEPLADLAREVSSWSALLDRPPRGLERPAWRLGELFRAAEDGRRLLCAKLAEPARGDVAAWRGRLLDRLRLEDPKFALDVYETAMTHHGARHLEIVRTALSALTQRGDEIETAVVQADWWGPLWALERSHGELLRARRHLGYDIREGLRLHEIARRLRGY